MVNEQKHASELMPKSEEALKIMQARSKQLAQHDIDIRKNNGMSFVHFLLGKNEHYGISYEYVHEVINNVQMAHPPFVPNYIAGVINWRGSLIAVIDLIQFFHPNHSIPKEQQKNKLIIIVHVNTITVGLLVHSIVGSEVYQPNLLAAPLSSGIVTNPEYIIGLHHSITAIIHVEALLSSLSQETKIRLYKIGEVHGE